MTTEPLYRDDAYLTRCTARITAIEPDGGVVLDRSVFYPTGGGQPGDRGRLTLADGRVLPIAIARKAALPGAVRHQIDHDAEDPAPDDLDALIGETVEAEIDWDQRFRHMRLHTALHLLSVVLPYPVTGGQIGDDYGRLDFDIDAALPETDHLTERLNTLIAGDHVVTEDWITDDELAAKPDLVKTMSVKPPMGAGRVRLVRIGEIDLQPCGGTHVRATGEIGPMRIDKIQSKGARNKRVRIVFDTPSQ